MDGKKKGRHIYDVEIDMERDIWEILTIHYRRMQNFALCTLHFSLSVQNSIEF